MDPEVLIGIFSWIFVLFIVTHANKSKASVFASAKNALVIKAIEVSETGPVYVHIVGRKPGFLSWLLSLIGIDPTTVLKIEGNHIEFSKGTLSGRVTHMIPLSAVCNLGAGYSKPFAVLVVAILMFLVGICSLATSLLVSVLFIFVAGCLLIAYYLKKTLSLFFIPQSSMGACIGWKRSVIEGVNLDETTAFLIIDIVSALIEANTAKS